MAVAACDGQSARAPAGAAAQDALIARADLFGDPARSSGQLSPRGDRVAFLAPRDGVMNLWVLSVDAMDEARPLTDNRNRGVQSFVWAQDSSTLVYAEDERGDEAWRLFAVDAAGGAPRALTPAGVRAEVLGTSAAEPNVIIVALNQRDPNWPDVFRVDLLSGERTLVQRNDGTIARFVLDDAARVRVGVRVRAGGGGEIAALEESGRWREVSEIAFEDAMSSRLVAIESDGRSLLMLDSAKRDTAALVRVDIESGDKVVLGESERADIADVWLDPVTHAPEAFATGYLRREWRALDADAQADIAFLDAQLSGDFDVTSRSADDARWIVVEQGPTTPPRSYLYDRIGRTGRRLTLLFRQRPALEAAPLLPMRPVEIAASDGLTLVSYFTLPVGSDPDGDARPQSPAPLVITPLSAPWTRESYGFNALHQWLANRGYAVLSVNVRGAAGFGKAFLAAGDGEWGARMQADLRDAAQWAVDNGIARPDQIAIVGSGFGGYAAFAGLTFAPDEFRCAASFGGFANLFAYVESAPAPARAALTARVGDPGTPDGRHTLRDGSPIFRVSQIRSPLLMALGARDAQAPREEADQIAEAVRARRGGLTYLLFPDEGRALMRPANRLSYLAVLEHFLGDCLGGRVEPVGAAFEGANIQVFDGAVNVPGLSAFARRAQPRAVLSRAPPPEPTLPPADEPVETAAP